MSTVIAIDKFLETDTDIKALVERIALGPQEAVINKIEALNLDYGTDFRSTPKFRWQPGFYKKLNEHSTRLSGYGNIKRKISTYQNGIRAAEWYVGRFLKKIQEIDTDLWRLRTSDMVFQDNTENVEQALSQYKQDIVNTIDIAHEMNPNITITPYLGTHKGQHTDRRLNAGTRTTINFHVEINNISMKVICGEGTAFTDAGDVEIMYTVDLIKNVMQRMRRNSSVGSIKNEFSLTNSMNLPMGHTGDLQGAKHIPNVRNTQFPYITGREHWHPSMRVEMIETNGSRRPEKYSNVCFGSFANNIAESFWQGDMMAASINLKGWSSLFRVGSTNPLNGYQRLFHGIPEEFNQPDFVNSGRLPSLDGSGCWINNNVSREDTPEEADSLCNISECSITSTCEWYKDRYSMPQEEEVIDHPEELDRLIEILVDENSEEARLIRLYSGRSVI